MPEEDAKLTELRVRDVKGVEVFASGTWNGDAYTDEDLDGIAQAFRELRDQIKPPVKLGHDKGQQLVQQDGWPAAGWIANVRRVGRKLVADFLSVPEKIAALIEAGGYRRVSAEIYKDISFGDKVYKNVLKAVALLGADIPAVKSLGDLQALYGSAEAVRAYAISDVDSKAEVRVYDTHEEGNVAEIDELKKQLREYEERDAADKAKRDAEAAEAKKASDAALAKALADKDASERKFAEEHAAREAAEARLAEGQITARRDAVQAEVRGLLAEASAGGRVAPVQVELFTALAMHDLMPASGDGVRERAYKEGEVEKKLSWTSTADLVKQLVATMPKSAHFTEAAGGAIPDRGGSADDGALTKKANEYIESEAKLGRVVTFGQALRAVAPRVSAGVK